MQNDCFLSKCDVLHTLMKKVHFRMTHKHIYKYLSLKLKFLLF